MPPPIRAINFDGDLGAFLKDYRYQPKLTARLDDLGGNALTPELVNEIVLWKVNRFVDLDARTIAEIEAVTPLRPGEHRQSESVLKHLLKTHGVDLPMASTLLRFRNPAVFQIIDRHAYRALFGEAYPLHTKTSTKRKIDVYFIYLDALRVLCKTKGLCFEIADRILYVFDKERNGSLSKAKDEE